MRNRSSTTSTEQELFLKTVSILKSRFGVDDLSTFEVLRIYRECRVVFEAFQRQTIAIKSALDKCDMEEYGRLLYNKFHPDNEVIHRWLRNDLEVDVWAADGACRSHIPKNHELREYIQIQRQKLI